MANAREGSKYNKLIPVKTAGEDRNKEMKVTDEKNFGKLRSIRIEPAANGFTVTSHHEPKMKKGKGGMASPMEYHEPEPHVFGDHESVLAHVKAKLEHHAKVSAEA